MMSLMMMSAQRILPRTCLLIQVESGMGKTKLLRYDLKQTRIGQTMMKKSFLLKQVK